MSIRVPTDAVDEFGDTVTLVFPTIDITRSTQLRLLEEHQRLVGTIRRLEERGASSDTIRPFRIEADAIMRIYDENEAIISEHSLTAKPIVDRDPGDERSES
jgi:hypothetical protein